MRFVVTVKRWQTTHPGWVIFLGATVAVVCILIYPHERRRADEPEARLLKRTTPNSGSARSDVERGRLAGVSKLPINQLLCDQYQLELGGKSFDTVLVEMRSVKTSDLLEWIHGLSGFESDSADASLKYLATACFVELARRHHQDALDLALKYRHFCCEPDGFRMIGENLIAANPSRTASLVAQSNSEKISGLVMGCRSGLLMYLRRSGDLEVALKNLGYLPKLEQHMFFTDIELPLLVSEDRTLVDTVNALKNAGGQDREAVGATMWQKAGESFNIDQIVQGSAFGADDEQRRNLAKGIVRRDPEASVVWLMHNADLDAESSLYKAVVNEWVTTDTTRASGRIPALLSGQYLGIAAEIIAKRAESEGNREAAEAWLKIAAESSQ